MSLQTVNFKDTEADLAALGHVCRELEDRGLPPHEAAAHVIASLANQAVMNGLDPKEAIDAVHQIIAGKQSNAAQVAEPKKDGKKKRKVVPLTKEQADEVKSKIKFLQNFLLYWDMILCTEIQRYAYEIQDGLKSKGMYSRELKKHANDLVDESRKLQIRVKDNDRAKVFNWVSRMDPRGVYGKDYYRDGGSIMSRFAFSFREEFKKEWAVVEYDCRTVAKRFPSSITDIVYTLLKVEALTNTGIELYDTCVKKMKALVAGHGTSSIIKSTHHESMRCSAWNLLRKLGVDLNAATDTEREYARMHMAAMHTKMAVVGMGDFFQHEFEKLGEEFVDYMIARMRMGMQNGSLETGGIRMVYERLGTKHRVKKFFLQLAAVEYPCGEDVDVFDVADAVDEYSGNRSEINRFRKFCIEGTRFEQPESEEKQDARMMRILARRNNYMLPDDILRVMIMKHGTKNAVIDILSKAGFELAPTLRRVRKMKVAELKQL